MRLQLQLNSHKNLHYVYSKEFIFTILTINTGYWYIVLHVVKSYITFLLSYQFSKYQFAIISVQRIPICYHISSANTNLLSYQFSEYQLDILWMYSYVMIIQWSQA